MTPVRRPPGFISQETDYSVSNSEPHTTHARSADGCEKAEERWTLLPFSGPIIKIAPHREPRRSMAARHTQTPMHTHGGNA